MTMRIRSSARVFLACLVGLACLACLVGSARAQEEEKTYEDARLGFSLAYPASLHLTTDPVLLKALFREGVPSAEPSPSPQPLGADVPMGVRFVLSVKPFGTPGLNPNLLLLTRGLEGIPVKSAEELARRTVDEFQAGMPGLKVVEATRPVTVAGRTFYTTTLLAPSAPDVMVRQKHYIYANFARQTAYFFTVSTPPGGSSGEAATFDKVLQGLRFDFPDSSSPPASSPTPSPKGCRDQGH